MEVIELMSIVAKLGKELAEEIREGIDIAEADYSTERYWNGYYDGLQYALDRLDALIADAEIKEG